MKAPPLTWLAALLVLVACSRSKNAANAPLASLSHEPASHPPGSVEQGANTSEATRPSALDGTPLEDPSPGKKSERDEARKPGSPIDLTTVEIRLDRTECLGWCPNYSVVISGNGHVQYTGRTFVREVGEREATVPQDTIRELMGQFEKVKFGDLLPAYEESVTDCPSTFMTLRVGDHSKRVENYWSQGAFDDEGVDVPDRKIHEQLDGLADAIDKAVKIEQWIGTLEERTALGKKSESGFPGRTEPK